MKPIIPSKNAWNQWLVICLYEICENYKFQWKQIVHMTSEYQKRVKNNQNLHLTLTFDLEKFTSRSNGYHSQIPHILFIWITYFIFINMLTGWCNMTITYCTSCILNRENGCHGNQCYIWNKFVKIGALYQNQYRVCIWTFGGSMVIFSQSAHTFSLSSRLLCPGSLVLGLPHCPQMVKAHIKPCCQLVGPGSSKILCMCADCEKITILLPNVPDHPLNWLWYRALLLSNSFHIIFGCHGNGYLKITLFWDTWHAIRNSHTFWLSKHICKNKVSTPYIYNMGNSTMIAIWP